jgi:uncharacterized protein
MTSGTVAFDEAPIAASAPEELAGPPHQEPQFAPVAREERINSLDVLRGTALMGILIMNITDFAMSYPNYLIPLGSWLPVFTGPHAKVNTAAWMLRWILAEGKMRAMFSMLFGAGAVLLTDRAERRGGGDKVADIFLRRNMWLLLIGFIHGFFIWTGDILFWYGAVGLLFLYPMRKLQSKTLIKAVGWLLLVWILLAGVGRTMGVYSADKDGKEAIAAAHAGKVLTEKQRKAIVAKVEADKAWAPLRIDTEKSIADHHGYAKAFATDAKGTAQTDGAIFFAFPDVLIFMMLGMALYKNGFLTGALPTGVYVKTALIGYAIALPLTTVAVIEAWRSGFEIVKTNFWLTAPYDIMRVSGALANAAVILLIVRAGALKWLTKRIAAVGQMALSNYLLTSTICQFLFVWGPTHWYQYIVYYKLYYIVAGVWAINLTWSSIWLKYFQFGPVEWLWRSLTYWKRQPMRLQKAATA